MFRPRELPQSYGEVGMGDTFPLLALPETEVRVSKFGDTAGRRFFHLKGLGTLSPVLFYVSADGFYHRAIRSIHTERLSIGADEEDLFEKGIVVPTGARDDFDRQEAGFLEKAKKLFLPLRFQVALENITYEATPSVDSFLRGELRFTSFYILARAAIDDIPESQQRDWGSPMEEVLMAVLDNSYDALRTALVYRDGKERYALLGDIKRNDTNQAKGRFVLDPKYGKPVYE